MERQVRYICYCKKLGKSFLLADNFCRRGNGQQGYVPANYVKEIEPATVTQKVKKTVIEEVPVIVKKKEKVKKRVKPIQRKRGGTRTFSSTKLL